VTVWAPSPIVEFPTHRDADGPLGRNDGPVCGASTAGLYLLTGLDWDDVPDEYRCSSCSRWRVRVRVGT
jgi:hypothetical protein